MGKRILADMRSYGIAAVAVVLVYFLMHALFDAFCPMVVVTGLPCPGCGLTRSMLFFVTGQFTRSFYIHPLGGAVVLFFAYCAWFRYVKGKKIPGVKGILLILVLTAIILYIVRMHQYFPNRPPYTYASENLLHRIFSTYGHNLK